MNNTHSTLQKAVLLLKTATGIIRHLCEFVPSGNLNKSIIESNTDIESFISNYESKRQQKRKNEKINVYEIETLFNPDKDYNDERVIKVNELNDQQLIFLGISEN